MVPHKEEEEGGKLGVVLIVSPLSAWVCAGRPWCRWFAFTLSDQGWLYSSLLDMHYCAFLLTLLRANSKRVGGLRSVFKCSSIS